MAPVSSQKAFSCRERTCKKTFTGQSNRDHHEKRFNHKPVKYNTIQPLFSENKKKYCYPMPGLLFYFKIQGQHCSPYERLCSAAETKRGNKKM